MEPWTENARWIGSFRLLGAKDEFLPFVTERFVLPMTDAEEVEVSDGAFPFETEGTGETSDEFERDAP